MTKQLFVSTEAERIIMTHEMMGQISDGMWENSRPHGHYRPWCDAEVVVSTDGKIGRTFWADKDNYNFSSRELLGVVGDRIAMKVKAAMLGFDEVAVHNMPDNVADYDSWVEYSQRGQPLHDAYWVKKIELLNAHGINAATMKAIEDWQGYTRKDLVKSCNALKVACRTRIND